jgi:hypothetical protein
MEVTGVVGQQAGEQGLVIRAEHRCWAWTPFHVRRRRRFGLWATEQHQRAEADEPRMRTFRHRRLALPPRATRLKLSVIGRTARVLGLGALNLGRGFSLTRSRPGGKLAR